MIKVFLTAKRLSAIEAGLGIGLLLAYAIVLPVIQHNLSAVMDRLILLGGLEALLYAFAIHGSANKPRQETINDSACNESTEESQADPQYEAAASSHQTLGG